MAKIKKSSSSNEQEEDRLSSLPDEIISNILSRARIRDAARTSVLSHRWRHLWTTVTRLTIYSGEFNHPLSHHFAAVTDKILDQLSSPLLTHFVLGSFFNPFLLDRPKNIESCLRRVVSRNVQNVYVEVTFCYAEYFVVPACMFDSQFLVDLRLGGMIKFELPETRDFVRLPNLKKLEINFVSEIRPWLGVLVSSCPLLQDLELLFQLNHVETEFEGSVDLICPNLKLLRIGLSSTRKTQCARFNIAAPELTTLEIRDCYSYYYFLQNPSKLVTASVDLTRDEEYESDQEDEPMEEDEPTEGEEEPLEEVEPLEEDDQPPEEDDQPLENELLVEDFGEVEHCRTMSKFVGEMSSVSSLYLKIESWTNIFSVGCLPNFCNVTRFETTLKDARPNGWKDLILSLQSFPNLKHLKVNIKDSDWVEPKNWCLSEYVPDCLVCTLKTMHISGFYRCEDNLKLLEYIRSNANVLEELCLEEDRIFPPKIAEKVYAMWKECQSLFRLPRCSSNCEVVFSDTFIDGRVKGGCVTCQIYLHAR